jgi:hypothetical protein
MRYSLAVLFISSSFLCTIPGKKFERSEYVSRLIDDKLTGYLQNDTAEYNLVILQPLSCGACSNEAFLILNEYLKGDDSKTLILTPKSKTQAEEKLKNLKNKTVILDRENLIGRYGLNYPVDLFFRMKKRNIVHYFF